MGTIGGISFGTIDGISLGGITGVSIAGGMCTEANSAPSTTSTPAANANTDAQNEAMGGIVGSMTGGGFGAGSIAAGAAVISSGIGPVGTPSTPGTGSGSNNPGGGSFDGTTVIKNVILKTKNIYEGIYFYNGLHKNMNFFIYCNSVLPINLNKCKHLQLLSAISEKIITE